MERYGQVIGVRPDRLEEYIEAHAAVWPGVLETISACNIRNYSIFHHGGQLFSYFEYHGEDFQADMARMAADPETQRWWAETEPMQLPLETRAEGEWWVTATEVFHQD